MTNIRELAESNLSITLEGDYSLPVELVSPGGKTQSVTGQVLYDSVEEAPETGEPVIVNEPVVTLRLSSLSPIPKPGEQWVVRIPSTPSTTAALESYSLDSDRSPENNKSLGIIRLYLHKIEQSE